MVILCKINQNSKICFYYIILFYNLRINLRLENGKKTLLNIEKVVG